MFHPKKIIVGIPAKNEEKTIGKVIKEVKKYTNWVYVFDDGSTDLTREVSVKNGANVISNPFNLGKGATLRFAIRYFLDNKILREGDIIVFIDADGQCDVRYIPIFYDAIRDGVDMIVLKRNLKNYPISKKVGNWILNKFASLLSGLNILDSESGYRAFSYQMAIDVLKYSSSKKYGIEMEMNVICGRKGHKISYVLSSESRYLKGKGTKVWDGVKNLIEGFICWGKIITEKN